MDLSPLLEDLQREADDIFRDVLPVGFDSANRHRAYALKKDKWYLTTYDSNGVQFWNSNKVRLDTSTASPYFWFGDDFYAVFKQEGAVLAHRLVNDTKLSGRIQSAFPELRGYHFVRSTTGPQGAELLFEYKPDDRNEDDLWWAFVLAMSGLVILFLRAYRRKGNRESLILAVTILLLDVLVHSLAGQLGLDRSIWYRFGTGHDYLNAVGALLIHSMTALPWVFLIGRLRIPSRMRPYAIPLAGMLLFFCADLIINAGKQMVIHSGHSFTFYTLYQLKLLTLVGIGVLGLLYYLLVRLAYDLGLSRPMDRFGWLGLGAGALIFWVVQVLDAHRAFLGLLYAVMLVLLILLVLRKVSTRRWRASVLYFLGATFVALVLVQANIQVEQTKVREYANGLINYQDHRAELILKSVEDRLAQEFLEPEDYANFQQRKDAVEQRIRQLYFSNYLEKYDLRMVSFDSVGRNINASTLYSFADLDAIYNKQSRRIASNYFYQITGSELINSYIAKYENCDIEGHYGTTYILLQPRLIQSEYVYPEAFENQRERTESLDGRYSHALYFNRTLINQKGKFEYQLDAIPDIQQHALMRHFGGYYHYYYRLGEGLEVVVSTAFNITNYSMSTYTYAFLLLLPVAFLLLLFSYMGSVDADPMMDLRANLLSTRIQTSLTLILLVGLLLSVYISINYLRGSSKANLEDQLLGTIKNISSQFQNTVDLEQKLKTSEQSQRLLNEEASAFKVDLNLYDLRGQLLSTTKSYLYDEQVLADRMNPEAFARIRTQAYSQLMLREELEGSNYISAYVPLFNARNEVIAYLNIPYFAKNEQLDQQISTVIVNLLNVFFLLMLGGVLTALIIAQQIAKPLLLIRDRFAETELGGKNEMISYQRDDEIGKLVKQYNQMVLELEASIHKLAASERESAWREMAKQVAHEIKNPLTPMKLSIQHLQRAYEQGGDKLDQLFRRTSQLLIEQIDSLSRMASEFSSFAQMPQHLQERFDLSEVVRSSVALFSPTPAYTLEADIQDRIHVTADQEQMGRVINNLIKNAIQSIPDEREGRIRVVLFTEFGQAVIRVTDNGNGIPEEIREKVFEPNFSTKTSGMGLGLAISRKIIEAAHGTIGFNTSSGTGTEFHIHIPLSHED